MRPASASAVARALVAMLLVTGCVQVYRPPLPNEPHAVLKLRRVYESRAGARLREVSFIDDHLLGQAVVDQVLSQAPRNDALLVHPRPGTFRVASNFFHLETRLVTESYQVAIPYTTTQSYSCGTTQYPRTCINTVTNYRYETRYRTVPRVVEISDGSCASAVAMTPRVQATYLLEYTYKGPGLCHLACYEQVAAPGGLFRSRPCVFEAETPRRTGY
jgi:hypothetical protein